MSTPFPLQHNERVPVCRGFSPSTLSLESNPERLRVYPGGVGDPLGRRFQRTGVRTYLLSCYTSDNSRPVSVGDYYVS